jgi:hypothetical protein
MTGKDLGRKMKIPHISFGAVAGALALWKEMHEELPGTGQSVMDLLHAGWSYFDVRGYFPIPVLNLTLFAVAVIFLAYGGRTKWTGYSLRSTHTPRHGH